MTQHYETLYVNVAGSPSTYRGVLGWHVAGPALLDGLPLPADGRTLEYTGPIHLCHSGLHGCQYLLDALGYARSGADLTTICRVILSGEMKFDHDKVAASQRHIIWRVEASAKMFYNMWLYARDVVSRHPKHNDGSINEEIANQALYAIMDVWQGRSSQFKSVYEAINPVLYGHNLSTSYPDLWDRERLRFDSWFINQFGPAAGIGA